MANTDGRDASKAVRGQKLRMVVEKAFDSILGEGMKTALLYQMMTSYNISFNDANSSTLEDVENVLRSVFGEGSDILIELMHRELAS